MHLHHYYVSLHYMYNSIFKFVLVSFRIAFGNRIYSVTRKKQDLLM